LEVIRDQEENIPPLFEDENAFEATFREYYTPLYRLVRPMVKSQDVAEDIIQELFIRLWNKRNTLTVTSSLKSYLYRAATNAALDHIEKHKKEVRLEDQPGWENSGFSREADEDLTGSEMQDHIVKAIEKLPPACKTIFLLSREKELSYKEIAASLDISVKTVENQMGKALKILREELKPHIKGFIKFLILLIVGL
jgi:RNA polymerase sigma-70 factor, ECF subfamily